jgi:nucleoside-diphosphate-sugar epimerase
MKDLAGRRIAVTGASGFIGGRVVERLILDTQAEVRPLVRGFGRAARLSVLPQDRLDFRVADIDDQDAVVAGLQGCDLVVHCAFGSGGGADERWRTTVDGTAHVRSAARAAGVRRLVHVSTVDVYDTRGLTDFDEAAPGLRPDPEDREYEQQKAAAERLVLSPDAEGPEIVVLQPGVVYGPWGGQWTTAQLTRPCADYDVLPTLGAQGVCNAVYVDDVVEAVLRGLVAPSAAGERMLVTGPEAPTWGEYFDHCRRLLGLGSPEGGTPPAGVEDWELDLYRSPARAVGDKADRILGPWAKTTLAEGMSMVAAWAAWAGHTIAVPQSAG